MEQILTIDICTENKDIFKTADNKWVGIGWTVFDRATGTEFVVKGVKMIAGEIFAIIKEIGNNLEPFALQPENLYYDKNNR